MRLIDADMLKNYMLDNKDSKRFLQYIDEQPTVYNMGIAAKEETTGWNLIGEKAPEKTSTYLVTYNGAVAGEKYPFTGLGFFDDGEWDDEEYIIAWKPLPEPYRES